MMPIESRDIWLKLAEIELPDSVQQTTEKLDYDPLLSALGESLQIATSHQQEASTSHQQQQKQQQQFIAEDIEGNKEKMARIKELLDKENEEKIATEDNSELINISFYPTKRIFENPELIEMVKSILEEIPNQEPIVQKVLTALSSLNNKNEIHKISKAALKKITENYSYFVDGIALNNVPAGFFIPEIDTKTSSLSLKFDSKAFEKINQQKKATYNSYKNQTVLSGMLSAYEDSTTSLTKKQVIEAVANEEDLPNLDDNIFDILQFTENNLKALAPVLDSKDGQLKTLVLIKHLKKLKNDNPELYNSFKTCFIDNAKNLLELTNIETINAINKLSQFTPSQKEWWNHLVKQHTSDTGVGKSNFLELFHTFDAFYQDLNGFWQKIYNKELELPIPCPINDIGNMQVALNRIGYIVKHAAHPDDQLELLNGLKLDKIHLNFLNKSFQKKLGYLEPKSNSLRIFLNSLYSINQADDPDLPKPYFPKYRTAYKLGESIENSIVKDRSINSNLFYIIAAQFLQREVQAKDIHTLLKIGAPYIDEQKAQSILVSDSYPLFNKEGSGIYLDPLYFKLVFHNPTTNASIFKAINNTSAFADKAEAPKADIFSCLLSINLENLAETVPDVVSKLYKLHETKPETLPILATILSHTDFEQTPKSDLTTKEQLDKIIESCKTETDLSYKSIKKIVEENIPNLKFLPDLEYAKTLINETPKDLQAIIKLFKPIFSELEIPLDPNNISKSTDLIIGIYNQEEAGLSTAQRLKLQLIKKLIEPNLGKLQSDNNDNKIIGLIKIIETARNFSSNVNPIHITARNTTKNLLKNIKNVQIENSSAILIQTGLNQETIDKLIKPIQNIDLSDSDKELTAQLDKLIETTSWVKSFGLSYIQLSESEKWELKPKGKKNFAEIISKNFDKVSDNINSLLNIYIKYPSLNQENFFSPIQLLEKIGINQGQNLTNEHINAIVKMAENQAGTKTLPKKKLEKILDAALQFGDPELTDIIINFSLDQEKYKNFPTSDFLIFINSFVRNGLKNEEIFLRKHRSKILKRKLSDEKIAYILADKEKELRSDLTRIIKDLPNFYNEETDHNSLNAFIKPLFSSMSKNADVFPYFYLKKILQEFDSEKQQKLFKIIKKISTREEETHTKNRNSLHGNIFKIISYLNNLITSDENLFREINTIYDGSPCPNSNQLLKLLEDRKPLETFKADFEIDPYGERIGKDNRLNESFYKKHFTTDKVNFFISSLNKNGADLSETFLAQLRNDFLYINAIGSNSTFPNTEPPKPIWKMSKEELQRHLENCKATIRNLEKNESEKYLAKLQALALLRETMYRTTGKTANSTQILSVLLQIKNKRNLCMEIKTGEGKSITNPLLAAMEYLSGYSVNIFTSNVALAKRDKEESQDFWSYLDIPTRFIARNSASGSYLEGGINYTTPGDFALYSAASKEEYENMAGVYDESDLAFYETNVDFNFADSIGGEIQDPFHNPFAWAYPLILNFVDSKQALLNELLTATNKNLAAAKVARQLRLHLSTHPDSEKIKKIDDNQLLKWIAAATSAYKLEEGTHFVIEKMTRNEYGELKHYRKICVINDEGHKIEGSVFANGIHQLLSTRLQLEQDRGYPFVIDNETFCVSSRNAHTELARMKKIVGITGTFGHETLRNKFKEYHDTLSLEIPRHFTNKRYDLPPRFIDNYSYHLESIKTQLLKVQYPTAITCPNEEQCTALYNSLKEFADFQNKKLIIATNNGYKKYDPATKQLIKITSKEEAKREAHNENTIIIATSIKKQELEDFDYSFENTISSDSSVYTRKAIRKELTKKIKQNQLVVFSSSQQCTTFFEEAREFANRNKVNLILATAEGFKKYNWKKQEISTIEGGIKEATKLAGEERTITISTAILGRGVNIRNLAKVITTYDPNERLESQVKGRTGRYGAKGVTIGIYDWTEICQKYGTYLTEKQKSATRNRDRQKAIEYIRKTIQEEEVSRLEKTFEIKGISIRYQQYFDKAIEKCQDPEKKGLLLWKKNLLINKLAVLQKTVTNENEKVEQQVESFETGAKEIWNKLISTEKTIAELLQEAKEELSKENTTNPQQKSEFYSIRTLLKTGLSDDQLVSEYQSRNQIIYLNQEPNKEQIANLPEQLKSDLSALLKLLQKKIVNDENIALLVTKHITPYLKFSQKWQDKEGLKSGIDKMFKNYIENINLKDDKEHLYLHYLSQAKILSENPDFETYNIKNITAKQKEEVLEKLQNHLDSLEKRQTILDNIINNEPTEDSIVNYYVTILKKQRGWFHIKNFGETTSFKKIVKLQSENIKETFINDSNRL